MTFDEWRETHYDTSWSERDYAQAAWDAAVTAERERCAQLLDAAHEQRKHIDNYAAFYARMVREARLIEGPNVVLSGAREEGNEAS